MRRFGPALLGGILVSLLLAGCGDADGPGADAPGADAPGAGASAADKPAPDAETVAREPSAIYGRYCVNCHGTGMAGAPMGGPEHRLLWSEEIEAEGFPTLVKIAIEGQNGMPPRGTCFDCSDEEIEATVLYMLKESGAK